jgi:hypothetical protein
MGSFACMRVTTGVCFATIPHQLWKNDNQGVSINLKYWVVLGISLYFFYRELAPNDGWWLERLPSHRWHRDTLLLQCPNWISLNSRIRVVTHYQITEDDVHYALACFQVNLYFLRSINSSAFSTLATGP